MSIQLQGNSDSVFSNDVIAPNLPTYQQGLWTPRWVSGVTPSSYVSTEGKWTRIGNLVTVSGRIQGDGGGSDGDVMRLGKMPYKQEPGTGEGAITVGFPGNLISDSFWCLVTAGQDYFQFFANSGNQFTGNDITSTGVTFHFSGSYLTDDTTWQPLNGATVS